MLSSPHHFLRRKSLLLLFGLILAAGVYFINQPEKGETVSGVEQIVLDSAETAYQKALRFYEATYYDSAAAYFAAAAEVYQHADMQVKRIHCLNYQIKCLIWNFNFEKSQEKTK